MSFKPVLLEAALAAVLDLVGLALRTSVERDKLLLKVVIRLVSGHLQDFLERTHLVLALGNVNNLVVGWNEHVSLWGVCLLVVVLLPSIVIHFYRID